MIKFYNSYDRLKHVSKMFAEKQYYQFDKNNLSNDEANIIIDLWLSGWIIGFITNN